MADTLTTNILLTKPDIGGSNNTWGDKLSTNFDRIDARLGSETEISTTGGTTTLSDTQENANVLDVAGALVTNATLVFTGKRGTWVIVNETSGAFTLTCKVTGQTGVAVAQGTSAIVRCDGTDVRAVTSSASVLASALDANGYNIGFDDGTGITDDSLNETLLFGKVASAINYLKVSNAATGNNPVLAALGDNTDIGITFTPKGAGTFKFGAALLPTTSDLAALGSAALMWSDLFLASGSVVNWNNGDLTLTHSANDLALAGGTLTLPNTGLHLLDSDASHDLIVVPGSNITADRTLSIVTGDADRALTITADTTLSGGTHSGTNTGDQGAPIIIVEDQKASGSNGGTFTSGADRTRVLNTEVRDALGICSVASNQITISSAGTYYFEWSCPAAQVGNHQSFLYDITGGAELKRGTSAYSQSNDNVLSQGQHTVTIAGATAFEIRHRCLNTVSTNGFGLAASFGTEIYTVVKIWKV